jgi:hypothetical protein
LALRSVTAQAVRGFTLSIWLYDYRYPSAACAARLLRSIFPLDKHRGNAYNIPQWKSFTGVNYGKT